MRATVLAAGLLLLVTFDPAVGQEASKQTGTIRGKVDNPYARRSEGVIYIVAVKGEFKPPKENPIMDQRRLVFIPHVLPVVAGTTVSFPNNDVRFALLGGSQVGGNALLRAYVWHCIGIPVVFTVFVIVHFWRVRKDGGISGPL